MNDSALVIAAYLIAVLAIGAFGRRIKGLEDFHLAGRSIKLVYLTGTFCASIIGASSTLGMAGIGFSSGLPGAWWMLSGKPAATPCPSWWAHFMARGPGALQQCS